MATVTRASATAGRRDAILRAALQCFTERGYGATTMAQVGRRSGASIGSMYHHFGGKEQLAAALYVEGMHDYQRGAAAALAQSPGAEGGVRALVRHHVAWVVEDPRRARFLLGSRPAEVAEATAGPLRGMNRAFFRAVRAWLDPHVESGRIRGLPFEVHYAVLLGPSQELARLWLAGRTDTDPESAAEHLARAAWNAVKGDAP
ncbi:MAG: TetR/AcrR family transcriptional regulator [Thermoleophilaceae bacterium]